MLRVVAFMKQVADGLQMEGNFGTAHASRFTFVAGDVAGTLFPPIYAHFVRSIIVR